MSLREDLNNYISEKYNTPPDYPWIKYPGYTVYRHNSNKKWFAVMMNIPKSKLGLEGNDEIDVINLKCDPLMVGSLSLDEGIFPAYHMNKAYWISVLLDGSVDNDKLKWLLDLSFDLTRKPKRKLK